MAGQMTESQPATTPPPPVHRHLRRAPRYAAVAVLLVLAWWLGLAIAGIVTAAHCYGSGGVWSEEFNVCECANYGGRWEGQQCIRPR